MCSCPKPMEEEQPFRPHPHETRQKDVIANIRTLYNYQLPPTTAPNKQKATMPIPLATMINDFPLITLPLKAIWSLSLSKSSPVTPVRIIFLKINLYLLGCQLLLALIGF